jgi:uncharacterized membrane protein YdjX (TVP38/TMEM64 family)
MGRKTRAAILLLWGCAIAGGLYLVVFRPELLQGELRATAATSLVVAGAVYLLLGCVRGFTLVPATVLVVAGIPFFPPTLLFLLTLGGILVSASSIYWFSDTLRIGERVGRKHQARVDQLKSALTQYELPVIIGWAFFPLVPTDVIGYVCGSLRINFAKYLLGVAIGEGVICWLYIFLGAHAMRWLVVKF